MEIRKAEPSDYKIIQSLRRKLLTYQHKINPIKELTEKKLKSSDELVKTYLNRSYSMMYLAFINNKCVGFIHGTIDPKPTSNITGYLQDFYVEESFRGQGIGSKLLSTLHEYFKKHDVLWGLTADILNKKTIEFYIHRGYKLVKEENKVGYYVIVK